MNCAWRKGRLQGGNKQKNVRYGERKASEPLSFEGRVEGRAPHPSLKGQGEGSEARSVASADALEWYVFSNILKEYIYYIHISLNPKP